MRPHSKENGIPFSERLSLLGKTVAFLFVMARTLIRNENEHAHSSCGKVQKPRRVPMKPRTSEGLNFIAVQKVVFIAE